MTALLSTLFRLATGIDALTLEGLLNQLASVTWMRRIAFW
jgi:hypothetical protein